MKFSKLSKILIVVLLVSVLAISLIACSTSKNNKDEKQSIDSSSSTLMHLQTVTAFRLTATALFQKAVAQQVFRHSTARTLMATI